MRTLVAEFKEFVLRGNMIDLAVGIILGLAFNAVVQSLANDILLNLIAAVFGTPDFSELVLTINGAAIGYGAFLTALVNFVLVAAALFIIVKAVNNLRRPRNASPEPPETRECPYCASVIANKATRCAACTSEVEPLEPRAA